MSTWLKKEDIEKLGFGFFSTLESLTDDVFLEKFFDLYKQIEECRLQISNVFGEGTKTELTLNRDPDCGSISLSLMILSDRDIEESRNLLARFDEGYWRNNRKNSSFSVYLEYV